MIAHNQAYFNDGEDDLYEESLYKNATIEHTREQSKKDMRVTENNHSSVEGLNLNVNSTTSSVEAKNWVPGIQNMNRAQSEIKVEQS